MRQRTNIPLNPIVAVFRGLAREHTFTVVEGAGGLMVPLSRRWMVADLIKRLRLPVLLVARPGLGTLNHTLLSLGLLRQMQVPVSGVVFCRSEEGSRGAFAGISERTNPAIISRLGGVKIVGNIPHRKWNLREKKSTHLRARWVSRYLDQSWLGGLAR